MDTSILEQVAQAMVTPGKGILAMDESHGTCKKRFEPLGVEFTEENRRDYRYMLISTPGLGDYISGVILFDETLRQKAADGTPFTDILNRQGILPGIKVDMGARDMALFPGEKVTEGLDGLRERLAEYKALGAKFAKWRAVITITENTPTDASNLANAHGLARYAALCQEAGIVPIVEPEVLMNGDHDIQRSYDETLKIQKLVFEQLRLMGVHLPGMVLKPSIVISGTDAPHRADINTVATMTVKCLKEAVPAQVPGCAFLSGGQGDEEATAHLNAMNQSGDKPWKLTFSYGRALQQAALKLWAANPSDLAAAQKALLHRARCNGAASKGEYTAAMESEMTMEVTEAKEPAAV